jgi:hypothetical protein
VKGLDPTDDLRVRHARGDPLEVPEGEVHGRVLAHLLAVGALVDRAEADPPLLADLLGPQERQRQALDDRDGRHVRHLAELDADDEAQPALSLAILLSSSSM